MYARISGSIRQIVGNERRPKLPRAYEILLLVALSWLAFGLFGYVIWNLITWLIA